MEHGAEAFLLDPHRPLCPALRANQVYCLIAALAYDLRAAIKLLDLNDDVQGWRIKTLMQKLVMLPGRPRLAVATG